MVSISKNKNTNKAVRSVAMRKNKKMRKRVQKGGLATLMLASAVVPTIAVSVDTVSASEVGATGTYQGENFIITYEVINETDAKITSFNIPTEKYIDKTQVTIPASVDGYNLVEASVELFDVYSAAYQDYTNKVFPQKYLEIVNLPNENFKLTGDLSYRNDGTPLKYKTTSDDGVTTIGYYWSRVFTHELDYSTRPTVERINIPDEVFGKPVTSIKKIKNLNADEVIFNKSLKKIYDYAIKTAPNVKKMDLTQSPSLESIMGTAIELTNPTGVEVKLNQVALDSFRLSSSKVMRGTISSLIFSDDVTKIPPSVFSSSNNFNSPGNALTINEIVFNEGLQEIGDDAFKDTRINTSIILPNTVTRVGDGAFRGVIGINELFIPESVTSLGYNAFGGTAVSGGLRTLIQNKVTVLNPYLNLNGSKDTISLATGASIYGYKGSTVEDLYKTSGFIPLDDSVKQPTVTSTLINGQTYIGSITPTFNITDAESVTYTLNGQPYDGVSQITTSGENTLDVIATNGSLVTKKTYKFNIMSNTAPTTTNTIENQTVELNKLLQFDVSQYFEDADGDALTYEVTTSDGVNSFVSISNGSTLNFRGFEQGEYTVKVKAFDGTDYSDEILFEVTVTEPVTNVSDVPIENKGEVSVSNLETNISEVIDVTLVKGGASKTINLSGLLSFLDDVENPTISLSSTNENAVSYEFDPETSHMTLTGIDSGFSNIQVVAANDSGKVVTMLMVDVAEQSNASLGFISNGVIYIGQDAYVVPLEEVYENMNDGESVTYDVNVTKKENATESEPGIQTASAQQFQPFAMMASLDMSVLSGPSQFTVASVGETDTTTESNDFVFEVPAGVENATLHEDENLLIRLVNSKLVVEGKTVGNYDVEVTATTQGGTSTPVKFNLEVKSLENGEPTDGEDPIIDDGEPTDGEEPVIDDGEPTDGEEPIIDDGEPTDGEDPIIDDGEPTDGEEPIVDDGGPTDEEDPIIDDGEPTDGEEPIIDDNEPTDEDVPPHTDTIDVDSIDDSGLPVLKKEQVKSDNDQKNTSVVTPKPPKTGDGSLQNEHTGLVGLLMLALASLGIHLNRRKKTESKTN